MHCSNIQCINSVLDSVLSQASKHYCMCWYIYFNTWRPLHLMYYEGVRCNSMVRAFAHGEMDPSFMVDPLNSFSFQPVLHDWCNKGLGMCYPVCRVMHIKEPLLLIGKSNPCGGSRFPLSLSVWYFTICLMLYNRM